MSKRALIFYISQYSGHFHAARAIEEGLLEVAKGNIDTRKVNAFSYTNPILEKIINKAYLEVIKNRPEIWGKIYDNPDVIEKTKRVREALYKFNISKIKRLIEAYLPDVILCTQAFPCGMVSDYKEVYASTIPLIGVLTDHAPHSYWLSDKVDFYIAPSDETARVLNQKGIRREKIKTYGIPISLKFRARHNAEEIRNKLGLVAEIPLILIMGGSQGLGAIEEIVRSILLEARRTYQLLIVTGSNKKLCKRLVKTLRKNSNTSNMRVLSFVKNIDELMEVSDIIITKAGGMTIAEALAKNLPILVVSPIPGHERMNTDYLVAKGAAIEIKPHDQIHKRIDDLFDSRAKLEKMVENTKILAKPSSAIKIAKLALAQIRKNDSVSNAIFVLSMWLFSCKGFAA